MQAYFLLGQAQILHAMFSRSEKLASNHPANRQALARVGNTDQSGSWITDCMHNIDAIGRTVKSSLNGYWNKAIPNPPDTLEHVYDRSRHIQNYDGTSSYG